MAPEDTTDRQICPECRGTGQIEGWICARCEGKRTIAVPADIPDADSDVEPTVVKDHGGFGRRGK